MEIIHKELADLFIEHKYLINEMTNLDVPLPYELQLAGEVCLGEKLKQNIIEYLIKQENQYINQAQNIIKEALTYNITLDKKDVSVLLSNRLVELINKLSQNYTDESIYNQIHKLLRDAGNLKIQLEYTESQNILYDMLQNWLIPFMDYSNSEEEYNTIIAFLDILSAFQISTAKYRDKAKEQLANNPDFW